MIRYLAVMLACGLALAGGGMAHAQDTRDDGMDCVYNKLIDSYDLVAEVLLYGDLPKEDTDKSAQAVEAAKTSCAATYAYTPDQREAAGDIGVMGSALDYLSEELMFSDVSEDALDGVLAGYATFTDADVDAIFNPDWRSDAAFYGKLKAMMLGAGIPDEPDAMDIAMQILEITAMVEETTFAFMMAAPDADAAPGAP